MRSFLDELWMDLQKLYWRNVCRFTDPHRAVWGASSVALIVLSVVAVFVGAILILVTAAL